MALPISLEQPSNDLEPVGDSIAQVLRALTLPAALTVPLAARVGDFGANLGASALGMRRPNPSALADRASRFTDPGFSAWGNIAESMNPLPSLRGAARSAGWQDVAEAPPNTTRTAPGEIAASQDIGVGKPAASRSFPMLGARSPVANYNNPNLADEGAWSMNESGTSQPAPQTAGAFAPSQAAESDDLGARYRARVAGIQKPTTDLTDEQKQQQRMNFFLNLLAGNQPGSRFLQNAGRAGLETSAQMSALGERNYQRGAYGGQVAREEALREMTLSDKSQDNKERVRHQKAVEDLQRQANDINRQYREGQISAREAELEVKKIQAQMAELRLTFAKQNPLEQQTRFIRQLLAKGDPLDLQALHMAQSKGKGEEDQLIDEMHKGSVIAAMRSGMPAPSRDQIVAIRKYGQQLSRSHPDYLQTLKSMGGDSKENRERLDNVLKTRGLRVVD